VLVISAIGFAFLPSGLVLLMILSYDSRCSHLQAASSQRVQHKVPSHLIVQFFHVSFFGVKLPRMVSVPSFPALTLLIVSSCFSEGIYHSIMLTFTSCSTLFACRSPRASALLPRWVFLLLLLHISLTQLLLSWNAFISFRTSALSGFL
jgi:hypothetical protein